VRRVTPARSAVLADPASTAVARALGRDVVVTVVSRDVHDEVRTTVVFH
jgi:hypothetical protein